MKPRTMVCVTGGTGLVGKGLEETRPPSTEMVSTHLRRYPVRGSRVRHLLMDVREKTQVEAFFRRHPCDVVVHAAGAANVDYTETHPLESWESNVLGTLNIVTACQRRGSRLIYLSSNAVFDGTSPPYREGDPLRPVNRYGAIKIECERIVRAMQGPWTIVRPILMYGWPHATGRPNFVTWLLRELRRKQPLHVVTDVYENPLWVHQLSRAIWEMVERKSHGVFHIAGGEVINRYQFARQAAEVFGLKGSLIRPVRSAFFPSLAPRPRNTSLATRRMERELGIVPLSVEEGLRAMKTQGR